MASDVSTRPRPVGLHFSPEFAANVPRYQRLIRRQPLMRWARTFHLQDDLEQLTLLELARVAPRFDPARCASNDHFFSAVLASRVTDCFRVLKRQHRDIVEDTHVSLDSNISDDGTEVGAAIVIDDFGPDVVLQGAMRREAVGALRQAIEHLAPRQREVIERVLGDFTDAEIADDLGVSVQAVNKTRHVAMTKLKQLLLAEGLSA